MNFELCTDSLEGALMAQKYGFKRIELCSALSVGGLTPSFGLIEQCVDKSNVEVHVMIRHKEGNFNYDTADIELMKLDIKAVKNAGAHGVVFGVLNENNEVSNLNKELVKLSKQLDLEVTFHRAFDFVSNYKLAIEKIINFRFDRLLTSGLKPTAIQGLNVIRILHASYGNQIQIMAGSGINGTNVFEIASSKINNIHFTARKVLVKTGNYSMGKNMTIDETKIKTILKNFNSLS